MKSQARVVVIGGGVVGVSTLYHLARKGWSDVVLVERSELTAGSTWHAAGLLPLFNMSYTVGQLHKYSVDLYKRLEAETGQDVSFHVSGNLRLATSSQRMDEYLKYCGTANTIGVPFRIITPDEVKALWPLVNLGDGVATPRIVGALYHPDDGHIAPVDLTMALRKGARTRGAEIYEQTCVLGVQQHGNSEWTVRTDKGDIRCEHVVCATGNYARETGRMFGLNVPAIPVEHQYIVYDKSPELEAYRSGGGHELAVLRESDQSYYLREERLGWILGPYERGAPARFADGVPDWFGKNLFEGDLDRLLPHVEAAARRVPALEHCGLKTIVNGPISYTPDGSPLIGPAWGLRNVWLNEGHSFGVTAAGGAGWQLAEWIVDGEPTVRHAGRRSAPLRPLHQQALHGGQERGGVSRGLHHPLPRRGAPRRPPGQDEPGLRQAGADGRGVRPALRLGARQLVRAAGCRAQGRLEFQAQQLLRARGQRVPQHARTCRRDRPFAFRQARGQRRRCRGLARQPGGQQGADQDRAHRAVPCAHAARRHPLGVHDQQARRAALLRRQRRRRRALRRRLPAEDVAGRSTRCSCATSPPAAAASCSPARARARCWPSSPTRRWTTRAFPG